MAAHPAAAAGAASAAMAQWWLFVLCVAVLSGCPHLSYIKVLEHNPNVSLEVLVCVPHWLAPFLRWQAQKPGAASARGERWATNDAERLAWLGDRWSWEVVGDTTTNMMERGEMKK